MDKQEKALMRWMQAVRVNREGGATRRSHTTEAAKRRHGRAKG